jgi:hypothetical protein
MSNVQIVAVKDRYGRRMHVNQADLDGSKTLIPLYTQGGIKASHLPDKMLKRFERRHGGFMLHRANICTHPLKEFQTTYLFGDKVRYCPKCIPNMPKKEKP